MERKARMLFLLVCATTLAACQTRQIEPDRAQKAHTWTWAGEKALLRNNCIVRETQTTSQEAAGAGSVVLTVAPTLFATTLDVFSGYLQKKKDAFTAITEYKTAGPLYSLSSKKKKLRPAFGCLILVKGNFGPTDDRDTSKNAKPPCPSLPTTREPWDACRLRRLSLQTAPRFYAEFAVTFANDGTSMALIPVFLDYSASTANRGSGSKDLLFAITLAAQLEDNSETRVKTFAAFTLKLSGVSIGSRLDDAGALSGLTTEYRSLPPPRTVEVKNDSFTDMIPIEILALVTETEDGGDFYVKAAEAVEAVKKPVSEQATEWLKEILSSKN